MIKSGRPRQYDLKPVPGFANDDAGYAVAALDELSARLCDLIGDLDRDGLDFVPRGTTNSIAMLVVHMAWAEAGWIARVAQAAVPSDLELLLLPGKQGAGGDLPVSSYSVSELTALCRRVRREVTMHALSALDDIDREVPDARRPMTVRGVLMHLIWHWTYHSGQVGLLRRLWGARYQWTFDNKVGTVPALRDKEEA
jgi:uncharacterized damage-inducible protein DinB